MTTKVSHTESKKLPEQVGLLAGWGRYPYIIAESLRRQGVRVGLFLRVSGHADAGACRSVRSYRVGRALQVWTGQAVA